MGSTFAWWYRSYAPKSGALERAEADAQKERRGLWRDKNPEPPWEFRRKEREAKGLPRPLWVEVRVKGPIEYRQYCDMEMSADPKKSMLAHFHGPLSMGIRTVNWKVPKGMALHEGEKPSELFVMVGTMSDKHGCWVVVRTCAGKGCAFPNAVRPVAKVEFPVSDPKAKPIEKTYNLDTFC